MRKILYVILIALLITLYSCDNINELDVDPAKPDINSLLEKEYSNILVTIKTEKGERSLVSTYKITKEGSSYILDYSVEKYNGLSIDSSKTDEKTISIGKIKFTNGKKEVVTGEDIDIDIKTFDLLKFKYNSNTFDKIEISNNSISGQLNNGKNYLNSSFNLNDFNIVINYSKDSIKSINYSYIDDDGYIISVSYNM